MTYGQAMCAFIYADATLAAKLLSVSNVKIGTLQQSPGDCNAVVKIITNSSWAKLDGATTVTLMRIEVTFWCKLAADAESMAGRMYNLAASLSGALAVSGPTLKVSRIEGPRTLIHPDNRYYGAQLDIIGNADMSTVS